MSEREWHDVFAAPGNFPGTIPGKMSFFQSAIVVKRIHLSNNLDKASIGTGAAFLQLVPLFGQLANTGLIIVTRALVLHVAEFAYCYVIARSAVSHKKIIQAQQEAQEAEIARLEAEQFMQFKCAVSGTNGTAPDLDAGLGRTADCLSIAASASHAATGRK